MTIPPWVQPTLALVAILVAIFREEIVGVKQSLKLGWRRSRIISLEKRLARISNFHNNGAALAKHLSPRIIWLAGLIVIQHKWLFPGFDPETKEKVDAYVIILNTAMTFVVATILLPILDITNFDKFKERTLKKLQVLKHNQPASVPTSTIVSKPVQGKKSNRRRK